MCVSGKYAEINAGIGIAGGMRRHAQTIRTRGFVCRIISALKRRRHVRYKGGAIVRENLAVWHKRDVTAFLATGVAAGG